MKELKSLQELVKQMDGLNNAHDDILMLMEMAYEEMTIPSSRRSKARSDSLKNNLRNSGLRPFSPENMIPATPS